MFALRDYMKLKVLKPVQAFPFCRQLDAMDCGPSCLRMIALSYGKNFDLQSLRELSYITKTGVNLMGISEAAESIGFRTMGFAQALKN